MGSAPGGDHIITPCCLFKTEYVCLARRKGLFAIGELLNCCCWKWQTVLLLRTHWKHQAGLLAIRRTSGYYVGLLNISQYSEGPVTGHLDTAFSFFPCVYKQMLRWFPRFQVATTCFTCSPPDLNLLVTNFIFCIHVKYPLPPGENPIAVYYYYYYYYYF